MTGFNHGLTGAAIAVTVRQPYLALPLALASHYLTDMIPHFGFPQDKVLKKAFNRFIEIDFIISVALMLIIAVAFTNQLTIIWACMIVAAAPDLVWWFYRRTVRVWPKGLDKFSAWHFKINNDWAHVKHFYYDLIWFFLIASYLIFKYHQIIKP